MSLTSPSHRLTFEDAVEIWKLRLDGGHSQKIAAHFDCNVGRVYEVLHEEHYSGSREKAALDVQTENPLLAQKIREFCFPPRVKAANDNQLDLFSANNDTDPPDETDKAS